MSQLRLGETVGVIDEHDQMQVGPVLGIRFGKLTLTSTILTPDLGELVEVNVNGTWVKLGEIALWSEDFQAFCEIA